MPSFQVPTPLPRIQRGSQTSEVLTMHGFEYAPFFVLTAATLRPLSSCRNSRSNRVPPPRGKLLSVSTLSRGAIRAELLTEPGPSPILLVPYSSGRIGRGHALEELT